MCCAPINVFAPQFCLCLGLRVSILIWRLHGSTSRNTPKTREIEKLGYFDVKEKSCEWAVCVRDLAWLRTIQRSGATRLGAKINCRTRNKRWINYSVDINVTFLSFLSFIITKPITPLQSVHLAIMFKVWILSRIHSTMTSHHVDFVWTVWFCSPRK